MVIYVEGEGGGDARSWVGAVWLEIWNGVV